MDGDNLTEEFVMHTYARFDVQFKRGQGMYLYDDNGAAYLDFLAGIGSCSTGHCHPQVTAALQAQIDQLWHVSNLYYTEQRDILAGRIAELLGQEHSWKTFFCNSGAESVEAAIKIARKHGKVNLAGAHTILALNGSFHGRTMGALAATGQASKQHAFDPMLSGFVFVDRNDNSALQQAFVEHKICGVLAEPIQGEGGVWPIDNGNIEFISEIANLCKVNNALLIVDDVQTGYWRTGLPFAWQNWTDDKSPQIIPDVVCQAKGIASGFPMGAVSARGAAGELLQPGEHGSTFGGSALALAAALSTIEVLSQPAMSQQIIATGEYFREKLQQFDSVTDVRGLGLMIGITLAEAVAKDKVKQALEQKLLINATDDSTLRFLPPLICTTANVDQAIEVLESIL